MKLISIVFLIWATTLERSSACTAFSYRSNGEAFVAKNLDWFTEQGAVYLNQRGIEKQAFRVEAAPAFSWTSKFASLTFSQTAVDFPWEGMNEAGVVVTVLQLIGSRPPSALDPRPELNQLQFIQYVLDRSANLREAIDLAKGVRISAPSLVHFFVCDASGACAVLENLEGRFVVHEGIEPKALANNPYSESSAHYRKLAAQMKDHEILRAAHSQVSLDRSARASVWSKVHVAPEVAIDYGFRALANLAELFPDYRTYWSLVFQPGTRTVHFRTVRAPQARSISFDQLNLECGAGAQMLDINAPLSGNVAQNLHPISDEARRDLIAKDVHLTPAMRTAITQYLAAGSKCVSATSKRLLELTEQPL